jgi:deazaflavin-dependent oxidoreductase (nitroreductase family)
VAERHPPTLIQFLRPYTTKYFNPISRRFVHWLPNFAIISYRGRKSGKTYRTPMNVFRDGESYLFALTYGPDVQWVKNVLASGEAELQIRNRRVPLERPTLFEDPTRHLMPQPVRFMLGLWRVYWFLRMWPKPQPAAESRKLPGWVPYVNRIAKPLLEIGVPMGPDVLMAVRGRKTGLLRSTPVTICETGGRRGVISPFGEVQWVQNLRAAGRATIGVGRNREEVVAVELNLADAGAFIRDVLAPHARRSRFGNWFVRNVDKIDIDHPEQAAVGRPVFELFPLEQSRSRLSA